MPRNIYKLASGEVVPGCTTVCGQLDKPGLLNWAWECGKVGKDWREERDNAGDIGTTVHDMILRFLKGEEVAMIGEVETSCFEKFIGWATIGLTPVLLEQQLVSEKLRFGGQIDYYGGVGVDLEIVDFKTGSFDYKRGCFFETVRYQLAGYKLLLEENGYKVKRCRGLYLPKDNGKVYEEVMDDLKKETRIFKNLLRIYQDRRAE